MYLKTNSSRVIQRNIKTTIIFLRDRREKHLRAAGNVTFHYFLVMIKKICTKKLSSFFACILCPNIVKFKIVNID